MKTNERVWTAGAVLMFVGMAMFYSCEESEAAIEVPPQAVCCDPPARRASAYIDNRGNAIVVGPASFSIAVDPGYTYVEDPRLSAQVGPRCIESFRRATARHSAQDRVVVVCVDPDYEVGSEVAPPEHINKD